MEEYANVRMHKLKSVIRDYAGLVSEVVLLITCNYLQLIELPLIEHTLTH